MVPNMDTLLTASQAGTKSAGRQRSRSTSVGSCPSSGRDSSSSDLNSAGASPGRKVRISIDSNSSNSSSHFECNDHLKVRLCLESSIDAPPGLEEMLRPRFTDASRTSSERVGEDAMAWAVASAAAEKALEPDEKDASLSNCQRCQILSTSAPTSRVDPVRKTMLPPPPPIQPPSFENRALLTTLPPMAEPHVHRPLGNSACLYPFHASVQHPFMLGRPALAVSPPPFQPPIVGLAASAPPPPPAQAPLLQRGEKVLPARSLLQPVVPPPAQPPALSALIQPVSLISPPFQPAILEGKVPLISPPASEPVLGTDLDAPTEAPPPSHAPVLRLVDAVPAPELGSDALPTVGSAAHSSGDCRPCAFLYTKGCTNGEKCAYCHLCEPGEKKRRMKQKRQVLREAELLSQVPPGIWGGVADCEAR